MAVHCKKSQSVCFFFWGWVGEDWFAQFRFKVTAKAQNVCNVVGKCTVGCLLFVSFPSIHASQSRMQSSKWTLFIPVQFLSLVSLSVSHTPIIVYWNSSVFNMCCGTEPMQHNHIHSIHWPFTHPRTAYTHINNSTDHSPIPQAHAIIPLHASR